MRSTTRSARGTSSLVAHPVRLAASLGVALALLVGLPFAGLAQSGEGSVSLPVGTPAPAASLEDLEGNGVELADYTAGGPALIEFWATWCEQCEALQPELDDVKARYGDRLRIVAVAVGVAQTPRRIQRHLEEHDPGYPFLFDARGAAVRAYNASTTSIVVLLDGEGRVAYTGVGPSQDLMGAVERLLES